MKEPRPGHRAAPNPSRKPTHRRAPLCRRTRAPTTPNRRRPLTARERWQWRGKCGRRTVPT
eukprot:980036-Lingulodinium_polyedra.AAC.1